MPKRKRTQGGARGGRGATVAVADAAPAAGGSAAAPARDAEAANEEYAQKAYWETRYAAKPDDLTDEWCLGYEELAGLLDASRRAARVVDLGCGLSRLLEDMRTAGWQGELIGVDFSEEAVKAQQERSRGACLYEQLDLLDLGARFEPESVDLFVDKMTMDAILHDQAKGERTVAAIAAQIGKALKAGGVWLLVSQMHPEGNQDFLMLILNALGEGALGGAHWRVTVNVSSEGDGVQVYEFKRLAHHGMALRKKARGPVVIMNMRHHGEGSDDEQDDEVGDQEDE